MLQFCKEGDNNKNHRIIEQPNSRNLQYYINAHWWKNKRIEAESDKHQMGHHTSLRNTKNNSNFGGGFMKNQNIRKHVKSSKAPQIVSTISYLNWEEHHLTFFKYMLHITLRWREFGNISRRLLKVYGRTSSSYERRLSKVMKGVSP